MVLWGHVGSFCRGVAPYDAGSRTVWDGYLVKEKIKDTPILLLDDVLSELDSNRQTYLLDSIHDIQTLITCTGLDDFVSHQFHINKVFKVVKGEVFNPVN